MVQKTCNQKLAKATDPRYICNPETGRWNLKKNLKTKAKAKAKTKAKTKTNIPIDRKKYKLPVRNYRCPGFNSITNDISNCSQKLTDIKFISLIGQGGYGKVYSGTAKYKNLPKFRTHRLVSIRRAALRNEILPSKIKLKSPETIKVAIKIIEDVILSEMNKEIEFSYYMDESKLGPKVYDAFFVKKITQTGNNIRHTYTQYIIMEPFDMNVEDAITGNKIDKKTKYDVIKQMLVLAKKQIYDYGLICYDMKPPNFLYNVETNKVKIIDFGVDFCTSIGSNRKVNKTQVKLTYLAIKIQLLFIIFRMYGLMYDPVLDSVARKELDYAPLNKIAKTINANKTFRRVFSCYTGITNITGDKLGETLFVNNLTYESEYMPYPKNLP